MYEQKQIDQTIHWLNEFTKLSTSFFDEGNYRLHEYWKGQVMGICKVADLINSGIDTKYYLNKLI